MQDPPAESSDTSRNAPAVISVRGETTLVVDPEVADLYISLFSRARDRREAYERLSKRNDEVLALIRGYGDAVEQLGSGGITVLPETGKSREEKIRSYSGSVRLNATVADFSVLGELVAKLSELETATLSGPYWRLRPASPVYKRARTEAVGEAVARARDYAAALGCEVTGLIELADTGMSRTTPPPQPRMAGVAFGSRAPAGVAEPPSLDLEPQQQTVYANIEARFNATQPDLTTSSI
jgi:uncharacterized protein YggE